MSQPLSGGNLVTVRMPDGPFDTSAVAPQAQTPVAQRIEQRFPNVCARRHHPPGSRFPAVLVAAMRVDGAAPGLHGRPAGLVRVAVVVTADQPGHWSPAA